MFADLDLLGSLPEREVLEGLAEAIKMGCIRSTPLFELLESKVDEVRARRCSQLSPSLSVG